MIHLNINDAEKEDLRQFLQHCRNWLTVEVHHTDTFAFREKLKQKEKLIDNLLEQLDSDTNLMSPGGRSQVEMVHPIPSDYRTDPGSGLTLHAAKESANAMPDTLIMNENRPAAKGHVTASVALSVPMIVAGALAIVLPPETAEGVAKLVGCVFILVGATNLALIWQRCPGGWHRATTLLATLDIGSVIAGGYVLLHPQSDFALLTYLVLMYLLGDSILQFILRDRLRRLSGSSWLRFEGTANSLILGILLVVVWTVWPAIPRQVIGVLVGISMLSSGIARLMISLAPPRAVETVHEQYHEVP